MPADSRREFLGRLASGATAVAVGSAFTQLGERVAFANATETDTGFGPLIPTNDQSSGLPLIKLPDGFEYRSFGWTNESLDDGTPTPNEHDGMAVISETDDEIILCRNHEVSEPGPPIRSEHAFDPKAGGGCTNIIFNRKSKRFTSAKISLSGTVKNCAGGVSNWNSWLSCEETVAGPGEIQENGKTFSKQHGYVFDVPLEGVTSPKPIKTLGCFSHEALCVDPTSGTVYLTEDADTAGFYRMRPSSPNDLHGGGVFEMLAVKSKTDCRKKIQRYETLDTHWVEIPDRLRAHSPGTRDELGVFSQGKKQGALTFARLEGCSMHDGKVFVTATTGGDAEAGQVWQYDPVNEQLKLLFESPSHQILDMPDNMTVSPRGGILLCEDGDEVPQRLQVLTADGKLFPFAANNMVLSGLHGHSGDYRNSEWCGATFSRDGEWLFVNLQKPGVTFAITGPWDEHLI